LDKYPGYALWAAQLVARDNAFLFLIVVSAIVLLWLLYSRTLFKRLENAGRFILVVAFYTSMLTLQVVLGSGPR
jgi:hypothetical protein